MMSTDVTIYNEDLELQLDLDVGWNVQYTYIHSSAIISAHNTMPCFE